MAMATDMVPGRRNHKGKDGSGKKTVTNRTEKASRNPAQIENGGMKAIITNGNLKENRGGKSLLVKKIGTYCQRPMW